MDIQRRKEISNANCSARSSEINETTVSGGRVSNNKAEKTPALSGGGHNTKQQRRKTGEMVETGRNNLDEISVASSSREERIDGQLIKMDTKCSPIKNTFNSVTYPNAFVSDSDNMSTALSVTTATCAFDSDCVEYNKSRSGATSDTTSFSSVDIEAQLDKADTLKLSTSIEACTHNGKVELGRSALASLFSGIGAEALAYDTLSTGGSSASVSTATYCNLIKKTDSETGSTDSTPGGGRTNQMAQMKNLETKERCEIETAAKEMSAKVPTKSLCSLCCTNIVRMKRTRYLGILSLLLLCLSGLMLYFFVLAGRKQGRGETMAVELVSSSTPTTLPSLTISSHPSNLPTPVLSQNPSTSLSSIPTSFPLFSPSFLPSAMPSLIPSAMPSRVPSTFASFKPSTVPSTRPSLAPSPKPTFEPTLLPSKTPTLKPVNKPTHPSNHDTFSFYAMGDVPYSTSETKLLRKQLKGIAKTSNDDALFMVHVGDIFTPRNLDCVSSSYSDVADIFTDHANLPVLVLPGDNDWSDCENPDKAWKLWSRNFMGFEHKWNSTNHIPKHVKRQKDRNENFSFKHADVLFLGLNIVGGSKSDSDASDWDKRFQECYDWAKEKIRAQDDLLRAVIIFGHAAKFSELFEMVAKQVSKANVPVIYIHGNGHEWKISQPHKSYKNFWQVQVDQGGHAPPIKVTVGGTRGDEVMQENGDQFLFDDFIRLDRRGGLYSWVNKK